MYHSIFEIVNTDCMIIPVFQSSKKDKKVVLPELVGITLDHINFFDDFSGKKMEQLPLYIDNEMVPRVLLVGLGEKKTLSICDWKKIIGAAVMTVQKKKWTSVSFVVPPEVVNLSNLRTISKETVIASDMAAYSFDTYKYKNNKTAEMKLVNLFFVGVTASQKSIVENGITEGKIIVDAVNWCRYLGNTPPSTMTPSFLAKKAKILDNLTDVSVKILSRSDIQKLGMGCLLGVARGAKEEPKFIIVEYWGAKKIQKPTVLVGKGITYDSGGLSLKPTKYMKDMKFDMLGGATVLAVIKAAAGLKLKKNIIALVATTENMPDGAAYKPDDILTAMNGRSVHITNTDAEGRLVLADALCYATKYNPKEVIDFATLTGACMVALGGERYGLFTNNEKILSGIEKGAEVSGELVWRLPLGEEFTQTMTTSDVADIQNATETSYGGASNAAAFLEFFTKDEDGKALYPWAHIDMASAIFGSKGKTWIKGGANGVGVQTMISYLS